MSEAALNLDWSRPGSTLGRAQAYLFSDARRTIQTVLGAIWLLDGGLQFQSFMYGNGFIAMLRGMAAGQPGWLHDSMTWGAHTLQGNQPVYNTLFALTQILIGLGLLWRPTTKPAIALSCLWAVIVWWFGEGFGMLFMPAVSASMSLATPLSGSPGAVILYPLIALAVWPGERPGGLLGARGARTAWVTLWILMAWLWLQEPSSGANAISNSINAAPSGMSWLSTVQNWAAAGARGEGLLIAAPVAFLSAAIGIAVAANWRPKPFLALAVALNLAYWVFGQGFGGIFQGGATDPNAGPLFVLLAGTLYWLIPYPSDGLPPAARARLAGDQPEILYVTEEEANV